MSAGGSAIRWSVQMLTSVAREPALIGGVLAVCEQRRVDASDVGDRRNHQRGPGIVRACRRHGYHEILVVRAERGRAAGHQVVAHQRLEQAPTCDQAAVALERAQRLRQPAAGRTQAVVDDVRVREYQTDALGAGELPLQPLQLVRVPDVVLVGERDDRARREPNRVLEVLGRAELRRD